MHELQVFPGLCLVMFQVFTGSCLVNFGLVMFYIFCLLLVGVFACPLFLRLLFAYVWLNSVCFFLSLRYEIVEVALNLCFI